MSEVIIDKITGKTAAGNIEVTSEGGAVTFQMQQGLAKAWANLDGTGTIALRDSFNIASVTDDGTGIYTFSFSSSMSNANYSPDGSAGSTNTGDGHRFLTLSSTTTTVQMTTGACRLVGSYGPNNTKYDVHYACPSFSGDLA